MTSPDDGAAAKSAATHVTTPAAKQKAQLTGVSETALLTLHARSVEARRADSIIDDPMAVRLVDAIDYDFARFGATRQDMPIRAKAFDRQTLRFLDGHPDGTVVALAEGLQTSFWRLEAQVPDPRFRWFTVDLPPVIDLRAQLLPDSERIEMCAQSALDYSWMDRVDTAKGVFITAEGLLMYLQPEQALGLIAECARRFPGGQMLFDVAPPWFTGLAQRGWLRSSRRYRVPPMPFGATVDDMAALVDTVPGIRAVHDLPLPAGRGAVFGALVTLMYRSRLFDRVRGCYTLVEFG
ncbi:class I SAM-dependent methyltransferase [Mycolicibacterium palauense]|uniref:class I SAM-dependent methyltransferase n=1 Tax=Mycolicibacterium palauense TaxID=2034511 RepID=UPI000BFEEB59|nr:class I SAM-dependent methyltransferase [Mycolicibacterium palauense]